MSQHTHVCRDCGVDLGCGDGSHWVRDDDSSRGICTLEPEDVQCEACEYLALLARVAAFNATRATA